MLYYNYGLKVYCLVMKLVGGIFVTALRQSAIRELERLPEDKIIYINYFTFINSFSLIY